MNQQTNEQKGPLGVFSITEYEKDGEKRAYWLRLGTAFRNKDDSYNILLKATPLPDPKTGIVRLHMRPPNNSAEQANAEQASNDDSFFLEIDPLYGAPLESL